MPGSSTGASFNPPPPPVDGVAVTLLVTERLRTSETFILLDNIQCLRIEEHEGAVPTQARLRYVLKTPDPSDSSPPPSQFDEIFPLTTPGGTAGVVSLGQELVVYALDELGNLGPIFDGFADAPQADVSPEGQHVTFTASGEWVRSWDLPIAGMLMRSAADPESGPKLQTELKIRFNPDGEPNCTPDGGWDEDDIDGDMYPIFVDHRLERDPDPRTLWNLGKLTRYLLSTRTSTDRDYVANPKPSDPGGWDEELKALASVGGSTIDTSDSATYTKSNIIIRDTVGDCRVWPEILNDELTRNGFALRQRLTGDDSYPPIPTTTLDIFRKDGLDEAPPKVVYLPFEGATLDPSRCNTASLSLVRDAKSSANAFTVLTRPTRYEASFVLACGFTPATADKASSTAIGKFKTAEIAHASDEDRKKYRWFVLDEAGDGHYDFETSSWSTGNATDLSAIFGSPSGDEPPKYIPRLRPGADTLFTEDDAGHVYRSEVAISTTYAGQVPGVWDGSATDWQSMGHSGWRSLKDRCGIEVTSDNPNGWALPDTQVAGGQTIPGNVVKLVERLATGGSSNIFIRYTTVIEGDFGLDAKAGDRRVCPNPFTVTRKIDARDTFEKDTADKSSYLTKALGSGSSIDWTDDTDAAVAQAEAMRAAAEFPSVSGQVVIPWFTTSLETGDRVKQIVGRDVDLRINASAAGESPQYPSIVGRIWDFEGRQSTSLILSDRRSEQVRTAESAYLSRYPGVVHRKDKLPGR